MRRILLLVAVSITVAASSQNKEQTLPQPGAVTAGNEKQVISLNSRNKAEDKTEVLDITGTGAAVFTTMNYPDGSSRGAKHALKITVSLLTGNGKTTSYQLVFVPSESTINYSVETAEGTTSVYYPMSTFEAISKKLDQDIAAKKKVQLKITQNPNGYREAALVL